MIRKPKKAAEGGREGAIKAAVSLLAYKDNTEKELFDKLTARGFSEDEAGSAVDFVVSRRYLCESRYFERFVENSARNKGYGRRRILFDAQRKGFSDETMRQGEKIFETIDFGECCYTVLKKCRAGSAEKAYAALMRRGYSTTDIKTAFKMYAAETGAPYGSAAKEDGDGFSEDPGEQF